MPPLLQRLSGAFLDIVFPPRCLICSSYYDSRQVSDGSTPASTTLDITALYFCDACREDITPIASPICTKCGIPFVSRRGEDHTCSECLGVAGYFRKARAFGIFDGNLMEAIHMLKYGKRISLASPLGSLAMTAFFRFWDPDEIDLLVSVPLHLKRLRERGFNQAHVLITRWARKENIPFDGLALCRSQWTEPQTTLSREERQKNIKGAFSVLYPERIEGRRILLVDDVYTTGATINECARVLMKAGAEFVDVLTLARAL